MLDHKIHELKNAYENLTPNTIDDLLKLYAANAFFKDPFQAVRGHTAIKSIFEKMFVQLEHPRFVVKQAVYEKSQISLLWEFKFKFRRWNKNPQTITGVSWLTLNDDYEITSHIDFWDPAEGIYEKLPILGGLMRFLKKMA